MVIEENTPSTLLRAPIGFLRRIRNTSPESDCPRRASGVFSSTPRTSTAQGFTLVEMIVVLAIIAVVTVVAVIGQTQFNNSLLLTDTAYTVALSVRQAQSLGISSRTAQVDAVTFVSNTGYGVHFANGVSGSYQVFADTYPTAGNVSANTIGGKCPGHTAAAGNPDAKSGNCLYDSSTSQDKLVQNFTFSRGFTIGKVCGHINSSQTKCLGIDFDSIDVSFLRPNTQTVIVGSRSNTYTTLTDICIHIASPNYANSNANVYVSQAGEVAVLATCTGSGWPSWP